MEFARDIRDNERAGKSFVNIVGEWLISLQNFQFSSKLAD